MRQILTVTKIKSLAAKSHDSIYADGVGLYFRKRKTTASWVVRRTRNKVPEFTTMGRYPELSLSAARKALIAYGYESVEGLTLSELLDDWYNHNSGT